MTSQSLSLKSADAWPRRVDPMADKAPRETMSFATCDRETTQAPRHFQLNRSGRSSLIEFSRRSLDQYRNQFGRFVHSLKFAQIPGGDWQAMPVTQH